MSGTANLPAFAPLGAGDIVSLSFQNAGTAALKGGVTTFGQVFALGELPGGAGLKAIVGGGRKWRYRWT
ncbi:hypothetical protein [Siccirubricoccus sp. G192]|uniref:hypothetical protein n=1 Tax=Siccirubricoccus sp. G192 TaxID=2849651 RepID=UPI001C2C9ECB|nr:hypothetical protein [Siccirubricoccus sp. G192]MBV1795638.1 hypothetical protein [Siccirubricoccus sp. G192]